MVSFSRTSWKLSGDLTKQALIILKRIYKPWAPCVTEVLEYSKERKSLKCRVRVPKGDYRYTRGKPLYVTCIQRVHILAQLSYLLFYFIMRDGAMEIFTDDRQWEKVENFLRKLGLRARWELRKLKKASPEEKKLFLNRRVAEILIDSYALFDEELVLKFQRRIPIEADFVVEIKCVGRYTGPTKLPGLIFKARGELKKNDRTVECMSAKLHNAAYTKFFFVEK